MVVHTPTKLDVLRQTAAANVAERRAAEQAAGDIPPSVLAAQGAAGVEATGVDGAAAVDAVGDAVDQLGLDGVNPPDTGAGLDDIVTEREVQVNVNVLHGGNGVNEPLENEDRGRHHQEDGARATGAAAQQPPPPNAAQPPPGLNPFTPERDGRCHCGCYRCRQCQRQCSSAYTCLPRRRWRSSSSS